FRRGAGYLGYRTAYHLPAVELHHLSQNSTELFLNVSLASLATRGGALGWYPHSVLTRDSAYPTHLVILWKSTFKEPWLLATNVTCPALALHLYGRRMWIEEMFGDMKNNGFDLEATHLRAVDRLNRLTLAVCLLFVWFIALGVAITQLGLASLIDRADRRDLSFFRRGFDWLDRCLALGDPLPSGFFPSFDLVLGSYRCSENHLEF
ncbi:MAG: transposase family protein, partial [Aggregatilineales bacterium]